MHFDLEIPNDMLQSVYFTLDSFEELFNASDDVKYLRRAIDEAYHMGEYQLLFSIENPTAGSSIGRCKFVVDAV